MTRLTDPIAMEVFSNRLLSITEDMGNTLIRSSFSTNIKERKDCSVGLFDAGGRLIAQASHIPLHLGSLLGSVQAVLARYDVTQMRDGDAFVLNDPYLAGGTHMPDISIVTPVFIGGAVRAFAANVGHHSDVGGPVPGSISGRARSIFEEGLRLPVIRLVRGGELDEDLLALIAHNSRDPDERSLDLKVQVAANARGVRLTQELVGRMGQAAVTEAVDDLLAYTARRLRNRVRDMADGQSSFTSYLDDDGLGGDPVPIRATVIVRGETLTVDFAGSGPETRGALNVAESALRATVYYAVKTLLDPNLLPNSGMFECIDIRAEPGSLVNPRFPAAVGARSITCNKIARALFGAFASLLPPDRAMASSHDIVPAIIFSGPRRGDDGTFVYLETVGGGMGARSDADGMEAIHVHLTNTSNLPAEALENEYSLLVDEYALVADSGGAGRYRGGLGIARQIRATRDGIVFSVRSDGHVLGAPGLEGGGQGGTARLLRNAGTNQQEALSSKTASIVLAAGETIRLETPGGGGFGNPADRDPASLAADVRGGKISPARARQDYGDVLPAPRPTM
ncbi:MAG TPA: hydantoinase B/oxoprolinase family protein [Acetobacteraceae bacterium]|jgi:N-methylhydantoinase B|nr:hydantoinase B/oxoprolinase family protein [Acetobacteraceae bacterium]